MLRLEKIIRRQKLLTERQLSFLIGKLAELPLPRFILKKIIQKFIYSYNIPLNNFIIEWSKIRTFNDFFSRKYKGHLLTFNAPFCSPAEGSIIQIGDFKFAEKINSKKTFLDIKSLTGTDFLTTQSILNIYLHISSYHRVHAPCDLNITSVKHIAGNKKSVQQNAAFDDSVYYENERVILNAYSKTFGNFLIVLVGALAVGKIVLFGLPFQHNSTLLCNKIYKKGEELGMFLMGSTVIILMEENIFNHNLRVGDYINVGVALF